GMGRAERQATWPTVQLSIDLALLGIGQTAKAEGHGGKLVDLRVSSRKFRGSGLCVGGCTRNSKHPVDEHGRARIVALSLGARLLCAGLLGQGLSGRRRHRVDLL